jgi:hypothetical protein
LLSSSSPTMKSLFLFLIANLICVSSGINDVTTKFIASALASNHKQLGHFDSIIFVLNDVELETDAGLHGTVSGQSVRKVSGTRAFSRSYGGKVSGK